MPFFKAFRIASASFSSSSSDKQQQKQQQQQQQQRSTANNGSSPTGTNNNNNNNKNNNKNCNNGHNLKAAPEQQQQIQPQLVFYCQLAHGSPTGLISGFSNARELYSKIAECFAILPDDILFCTLNTHKIDMGQLIGGQIGLDDFIFAHKKGRPKEIELLKTEPALGLTLTDNGAGYVFIKRIRDGSIMDRLGVVHVGDHLEKLNNTSLVGKRHYEVARLLKEIECGSSLLLRLVEPISRATGFGPIGLRSAGPRSRAKFAGYPSGKETLRFKADGFARIEQVNETDKTREQIEKINNALDNHMGISDYVLARRLWEIAQNKINSMDLAKAIDCALPDAYDFPKDFIFDVWKIAFETRKSS